MSRFFAVVLVGLALPAGAFAATPVLGSAKFYAPNSRGFGHAHPRKVDNGGDPGGIAYDLTWRHWGSSSAYAFGKAYLFKPSGGYYAKPGRVELRAFGLGHCPGSSTRAYTKLKAREAVRPGGKLGQWFTWAGAKTICG